ncbi:MAG: hypothetical protein MI867_14030 [Pseudomonadales bacterium]|nr:hypothetical protein [Pseudomonadales bacterium]
MEMSETELSLEKLESEIAVQDHNAAYNTLLKFLRKTSVHRSKKDEMFSGFTEEQAIYIATRFTAAVNFLFLQRSFALNEQGLRHLIPYQSNYAAIVYISPFKNSDFVIRRILNMDEEGAHADNIQMHDFFKLIFLWSPYSRVQLPFKDFLNTYPQHVTPVVLSALRALSYIEEHAHENREAIIQTLVELGDFDLKFANDDQIASMIGPAWMNISYATSPNKYKAKLTFNHSYKKWMKTKGVKAPALPAVRKKKDKPVLGIVSEVLNATHAMFRTYGDTLKELRTKFHTIGFYVSGLMDENVFDVFDEVVELPNVMGEVKKVAGGIIKKQPDILLYTSIGMNNVLVPITNLRIAPIQMAFLGHPNSPHSTEIDYIGCETCSIPYTKVFMEKIMDLGGTLPMVSLQDRTKWVRPEKEFKEKKQLDIAVPSMVMKLNYEFLAFLAKIKANVSRNIRFHFFPHIHGITMANARSAIHKILPESKVHPPYAYVNYLAKLAACDLHLGPFPFNNSNGNVDSMLAGLPLVVLRGDPDKVGVEGIADVSVLEKSKAPQEMIANNLEEYFEKACRFIEDDEYRWEMTRKIMDIDLNETMFEKSSAANAVTAMWDVYENHEKYMASEQQVVSAFGYEAAKLESPEPVS